MDVIYAAHAGELRPMALEPLGFPAIFAASSDDPYATIDVAGRFAARWGAEFADVGACGHIGTASRLGCWPDGLVLLGRLLAAVER